MNSEFERILMNRGIEGYGRMDKSGWVYGSGSMDENGWMGGYGWSGG